MPLSKEDTLFPSLRSRLSTAIRLTEIANRCFTREAVRLEVEAFTIELIRDLGEFYKWNKREGTEDEIIHLPRRSRKAVERARARRDECAQRGQEYLPSPKCVQLTPEARGEIRVGVWWVFACSIIKDTPKNQDPYDEVQRVLDEEVAPDVRQHLDYLATLSPGEAGINENPHVGSNEPPDLADYDYEPALAQNGKSTTPKLGSSTAGAGGTTRRPRKKSKKNRPASSGKENSVPVPKKATKSVRVVSSAAGSSKRTPLLPVP